MLDVTVDCCGGMWPRTESELIGYLRCLLCQFDRRMIAAGKDGSLARHDAAIETLWRAATATMNLTATCVGATGVQARIAGHLLSDSVVEINARAQQRTLGRVGETGPHAVTLWRDIALLASVEEVRT